MRFLTVLSVLGQGALFAEAAKCNADNCARAVTGTIKGPVFQSSARQDCSNFIQSTVYPASTVTITSVTTEFPFTETSVITTSTSTQLTTVYPFTTVIPVTVATTTETSTATISSTVITTTTTTIGGGATTLKKRDESSPTVPAYASACSGTVRYSSACSCWGITKTTITLPTPTTTTISTIYSVFTQIVSVAATSTQTVTLTDTLSPSVTATVTIPSTTTVVSTSTVTQTDCAVPSGNILANPGFNDGTYTGWNPGGYGAFAYSIATDSQCGSYAAQFTISGSVSYARIGQRFDVIDTSKSYQIRLYSKIVSGNGANCFLYTSCQLPGSFSSAGNPRLDTPLSSIPSDWTQYTLNCPAGANKLTMSLTVQCNQGTGPVTVGIDEVAMYPI